MNANNIGHLVQLSFIVGAALFVIGLHLMNSPATARTGNRISATGMVIAIVAELVFVIQGGLGLGNWVLLIGGLALGGGLGLRMARTVAMTSMPQLVSLFNAVGGAAAALLALNDFIALDGHRVLAGGVPGLDGWRTLFIIADVIIGSVTFTGSLIASAKLMGRIKGQPILIPGGRIFTWLLLVAGLSVSIVMILAGAGVVTYDSHVLTLLLL
ncbi:MAG TPA: NAD(P)(+) transhydrogenase (Re/Si-specific) subunit beta, partial [Candidatus Limnocylindrales bacterium]